MSVRVVVGIDPGGKDTGVVLRVGADLRGAWTLSRDRCDPIIPTPAELAEILETIDLAATRGMQIVGGGRPVVAVEGLVGHEIHPSMRQKTTGPIVATAAVIGAVLAAFPAAVIVDPGGNGSGPLEAYPSALRPTRGQGKGADGLRHCRSAWDVAIAGERLARHGSAA